MVTAVAMRLPSGSVSAHVRGARTRSCGPSTARGQGGIRPLAGPLYARLHGVAYSILGDAHQAEDATQQAMLRVWSSLPRHLPGRCVLALDISPDGTVWLQAAPEGNTFSEEPDEADTTETLVIPG